MLICDLLCAHTRTVSCQGCIINLYIVARTAHTDFWGIDYVTSVGLLSASDTPQRIDKDSQRLGGKYSMAAAKYDLKK